MTADDRAPASNGAGGLARHLKDLQRRRDRGETLQTIASVYGVSRERVRQVLLDGDPDHAQRTARAKALRPTQRHITRRVTNTAPAVAPAFDDPALVARFLARVDRSGPVIPGREELGPCWTWTGATDGQGYGVLKLQGRMWRAHRYALAVFLPEPGGRRQAALRHHCHDLSHDCPDGPRCLHRRCVSPDHLADLASAPLQPSACPAGHGWPVTTAEYSSSGERLCWTCLEQTASPAYAPPLLGAREGDALSRDW